VYIQNMKKSPKTVIKPIKVPFNMIGADGELVNAVREAFEKKLGTRLSAVQVARIVFTDAAQKEGVQ
jgi:hypothetical protein